MLLIEALMQEKNQQNTAKKKFSYAYLALFKHTINKIHIQNNSTQIKHKPNYNMICTKESITLHIQHGFKWETWLYDIKKDDLELDKKACTSTQWNTFISLYDYICTQADHPHVLYTKTG